MGDIARATIVGRLTRDPELNESGRVLSLGLAVNRRVKDREGEWGEEVSFLDVKVLGNRAEPLSRFLSKGRQVAVDARIVQERWEAKDGTTRSAVRFLADEVVLFGDREAKAPSSDVPNDFVTAKDFAAVADDDKIPF
jgi:single-strand DNA-binding protein